MQGPVRHLWGSTDGAVAPTIALSLVGLIAAGGIAFDYARVASMDTELQAAADQAALAAATQLDGKTDTCERAVAAAREMLASQTLMANDGDGLAVAIADSGVCDSDSGITDDPAASIRFFQDIGKATPADDDSNARFVLVKVDPREANFALTPIVAAFSSGQLSAMAFAGLDSAVCKTPPVMICNPQETTLLKDFDITALEGKGLRLVSQGGGSGTWAPGNYGYLDTQGGSNGAPGLREGLGWGTPPGDCVSANGVDTKPGVSTTVTDALNTRFDIYDGNTSCPTGGACPASINSVKDVRRPANANGTNACKLHNQGWQLPSANYYGSNNTYPSSATAALATTLTPTAMGHPRDMCHAVASTTAGACTGTIGNGSWDRDAYFRTNYRRSNGTYWTGGTATGSWRNNTGLSAAAKRYDVYKWEIDHGGQVIDGVTILGSTPPGATGSTLVGKGSPVCSPWPATRPSDTMPDRRKISVAVVNCLEENVHGNSVGVDVKDWIDVFIVEPSLNRARTNAGDIYVEVIGRTENATAEGAVQLVKKSVPYLIE